MRDYILHFAPKHAILTKEQLIRLANIFDNAGQIIFGVVVVTPIVTGFDSTNLPMIVSGLVGAITLWMLSLYLSRKVDQR